MERSKADSFTAYLEEKQRLERRGATPAAGGTALSLVAALAAAPATRMAVADLHAASGMSILDFAETLKRLADSGYLTLGGASGQEEARLTALGADVASLAGPR